MNLIVGSFGAASENHMTILKPIADYRMISRHAGLCGNKARNLAFLRRHGLPVPPFIVIPLGPKQENQSASFDDREIDAIKQACAKNGINLFSETVAVRSSASFEDRKNASFAGQLESILNVKSLSDLAFALQKVQSSVMSPKLVSYLSRFSRFQRVSETKVAVIIQRQIDARFSGILFSSHPLSRRGLMLIEYHSGGCEAIASGAQHPFQVIVDKQEKRIIERTEGGKDELTLTDGLLNRLIKIGLHIERLFHRPVDIEWSLADGELWILQARPITFRRRPAHQTDDKGEEWSNFFFSERFDRPLSPLAWSFLQPIISRNALEQPLKFLGRDRLAAQKPLLRLINGFPHARASAFYALYSIFPPRLLSVEKRFMLSINAHSYNWIFSLLRALPFLVSRMMLRDFQWIPRYNLKIWRRFVSERQPVLEEYRGLLKNLSIDQAMWLLKETQIISDIFLSIHRWSLVFAEIFTALMDHFLVLSTGERFSSEVLAAVPGENATVAANLALFNCNPKDQQQLEAFMRKHGHRSNSLDFSQPCWIDRPAEIFRNRKELQPLLDAYQKNLLTRREILNYLNLKLEKMSRFKKPFYQFVFKLLTDMTREFVLLRENQRDFWHRILYISRQASLRVGSELQFRGVLDQCEDVFYLNMCELERALQNTANSRSLVNERKSQSAAGKAVKQTSSKENGRERLLIGVAVSEGKVTGRARIARSYEDASAAEKGEIIIASAVDPGWTPLFGRIGGLVMENGGVLSHAAIVAREFRLPAVTSVHNAVAIIHDGDYVTVDGGAGIVKIHSRSAGT